MNEALYSREILRLAVAIPHQQRLENPDGSAERRSQACGSRVIADVVLSDAGTVEDLGLEINACALGQASAAILGGEAVGKTGAEIIDARNHLADFLTGTVGNAGTWKQVGLLEAAREHRGRHAAILLPFDAVIGAIEVISSKHRAA